MRDIAVLILALICIAATTYYCLSMAANNSQFIQNWLPWIMIALGGSMVFYQTGSRLAFWAGIDRIEGILVHLLFIALFGSVVFLSLRLVAA